MVGDEIFKAEDQVNMGLSKEFGFYVVCDENLLKCSEQRI